MRDNPKDIIDRYRGCLIGGAIGDALGYPVEFIPKKQILAKYGQSGICEFDLQNDKALISDDTQMALFTANGMLMGVTRGYMRGIGGRPEMYVEYAYKDWYYTQTGCDESNNNDSYTWLKYLPELKHRRAPGMTCLDACRSIIYRKEVQNNSKGCGGIMRVAPMGLIAVTYDRAYGIDELFEAGCKVASVTHKHPLGFLPAGALSVLIHSLVSLTVDEVKAQIDGLVFQSHMSIACAFDGKYSSIESDSYHYQFRELTEKALELAKSDIPDEVAIKQLGEGWVAEEAWAIALYCAIRHIDDPKAAIIAAVNHDGDSDSTGSITGNIIGAIYGYDYFKSNNLFCPKGRNLEDTLELHEIIIALADDLATQCPISEYAPIDTKEQTQWLLRYCYMQPQGIGDRDFTHNNNTQ